MWVIEASENAKCLPAWSFYTQAIRFLAPLLGAVAEVIVKVSVLFPPRSPVSSPSRLAALPVEQKLLAFNSGIALATAYHRLPVLPSLTLPRAFIPSKGVRGKFGPPGLVVLNPAS